MCSSCVIPRRSVHDGVKKEKNLVNDINFCMKYVIMTPDEKERLAIQEFKANEVDDQRCKYLGLLVLQ